MGKHYEYLNKLYAKLADRDVRDEFFGKLDEHLDSMEKRDPKSYEHIINKMEDVICAISKEDAEVIVKKMSPRGQYWDYNTIKAYLEQKGVKGDIVHYYLVMNMAYNDYYETAAMYGLQKDPEFFFSIAKNFITDPDGIPHKVEKYFIHD